MAGSVIQRSGGARRQQVLTGAPARIALYADKLSRSEPTGIGQYIAGLVGALGAKSGDSTADYIVCSTRERGPLTVQTNGLEVRRIAGQRQLVQLGWCTVGRPQLETSLGPLSLVHLLAPSVPVASHAPLVVTVHDLTPLQYPSFYGLRDRWTFRRAMALTVRRATAIIAVSQRVADDVRTLLGVAPNRLHVVHHGISDAFRRTVDSEKIRSVTHGYDLEPGGYLLYVGTITARKNLSPLIQAYARVRERRGPGLPLVLAGASGLGAEAVDQEIGRLGLARDIRITGYLPAAQLIALLAGATALVHPAIYEGFGFTPLEAMAVGTPVIASRGGSLPEIVGPAGLLVEPSDVDGWSAALLALLGDRDLQSQLRTSGRRRSADFTWERAASATEGVYQQVLATRSGVPCG